MPGEQRPLLDAPRLLTVLCEAEVAFVIVGGMAAVAQGSAYLTVDLDICYERTAVNYQRISRLWVLTLEGLIQAKQAAGRGKDLRLIPELKALQALRKESEKKEGNDS
jgi:hypothetical protein